MVSVIQKYGTDTDEEPVWMEEMLFGKVLRCRPSSILLRNEAYLVMMSPNPCPTAFRRLHNFVSLTLRKQHHSSICDCGTHSV